MTLLEQETTRDPEVSVHLRCSVILWTVYQIQLSGLITGREQHNGLAHRVLQLTQLCDFRLTLEISLFVKQSINDTILTQRVNQRTDFDLFYSICVCSRCKTDPCNFKGERMSSKTHWKYEATLKCFPSWSCPYKLILQNSDGSNYFLSLKRSDSIYSIWDLNYPDLTVSINATKCTDDSYWLRNWDR